jgi:hypothetical protein
MKKQGREALELAANAMAAERALSDGVGIRIGIGIDVVETRADVDPDSDPDPDHDHELGCGGSRR